MPRNAAKLKLVSSQQIRGPSDTFIRRGRNPDIEPPSRRFEPTTKAEGDIVL